MAMMGEEQHLRLLGEVRQDFECRYRSRVIEVHQYIIDDKRNWLMIGKPAFETCKP